MPPRLSHKKTRTGCQRCKARKVKGKPRCSACLKHGVNCIYPVSPYGDSLTAPQNWGITPEPDHLLEMRLMHEWTSYTCMTLSTTWEFWRYRVPLIAFEFRHVLDAILAITALSASRQKPRHWSALEGRMLPVENGSSAMGIQSAEATIPRGWKRASEANQELLKNPGTDLLDIHSPDPDGDMLKISRRYFDSTLEGQQTLVANMKPDNFKAAYISSILVCYYALFTLAEGCDDDDDNNMVDPITWFRLSRGTMFIISRWKAHIGDRWFIEAGSMYQEPDLSDDNELFRPEHQEPFKYLLSPVAGDIIAEDDQVAYEHTLSYIGLIYKGIIQDLDSPLGTGRRVTAMPARVPLRFSDLIEFRKPRALAMLAHTFALMKLAEDKFPWFKGIAECQVPIICKALPSSWVQMIQWPLEMVKADSRSLPS